MPERASHMATIALPIAVLFVHEGSDVPCSDAQMLDVFRFVFCNRIRVASLSAVSQLRKVK